MTKAYRTLLRLLERQYGAVETAAAGAGASAGAAAPPGEGANVAALLANPQTNAAAFLVLLMVMLLMWRLAFMQPAILQAMRGVAGAVAQR